MTKIEQIQTILGVVADNDWGPKSQAALEKAIAESHPGGATVKASSFADPADVAAFRRCKANGGSDQECFKVGDNGIGFTGLDCADPGNLYCALPPEVWKARWGNAAGASGKGVRVSYKGASAVGAMGDTMPSIANIHNGARIDLNPGFAKALGLTPPFLVDGVSWEWLE